jgi:hypothetical protein
MVTVEDDVILYKNCIKLTNIQQGPRHKISINRLQFFIEGQIQISETC